MLQSTSSQQQSNPHPHHGAEVSRKKDDPCPQLRVILLGDMRVGKTSLLLRFTKGRFDMHIPRTVAIEEIEKEVTVDNKRYILHMVDTCGGERFHTLRENFYRGTHVCLLTFALDSLSSFCNLTMWREEFLYYSNVPTGCEFPFLVIGNKADIQQRAVNQLNAQAWCGVNGDVPYFETSAKEALNVEDVFTAAVRRVQEVAAQNAPLLRALPGSAENRRANVIKDLGERPIVDNSEEGSGGGGKCCS